MNLASLLPRALSTQTHSELATIMHACIMRVHMERRMARRFGWRGIKPSFSHRPAWSARVATSDLLFGLVFEGETCDNGLLTGHFALYAFSEEASAEPHRWLPEALEMSEQADFEHRIRELSAHAEALSAFLIGEIEVIAAMDGSGLAMTYSAKSIRRVRRADGKVLCTQRPLRMACGLFSVLATSMADALGEEPELVASCSAMPAETFTGQGFDLLEAAPAERLVSLSAVWGGFVGKLPGHRLRALPMRYKPHQEDMQGKPVVHVVSGFLGSGKTTFLKQWLDFLHNRERFSGVIQNEFGEIDLDSLLLQGQTRIEAIDDGCLCCRLADNLRPALQRMMDPLPAEQYILETTGVASPSNVMGELMVLNDMVSPGLLITIVDAYDLVVHPERLTEAQCRRNQIESADVIVLNKADAVTQEALQELAVRLSAINSQAWMCQAQYGQIQFAALDALYYKKLDAHHGNFVSRQAHASNSLLRTGAKMRAMGALQAAEEPFGSMTLTFEGPVALSEIIERIDALGEGVRRAKGLVELAEHGPAFIQWAAGVLSWEPAESMAEHIRTSGGFLVIIGLNAVFPQGMVA